MLFCLFNYADGLACLSSLFVSDVVTFCSDLFSSVLLLLLLPWFHFRHIRWTYLISGWPLIQWMCNCLLCCGFHCVINIMFVCSVGAGGGLYCWSSRWQHLSVVCQDVQLLTWQVITMRL